MERNLALEVVRATEAAALAAARFIGKGDEQMADKVAIEAMRIYLEMDLPKVATTLGYGPRYLHSTGQLHKGGPPRGHFLEVTTAAAPDLPIPGKPFTFGQLEAAQAEGDLLALERRGRPVLPLRGLDLLER